jgi:orotate phosphoribosyltransferase
MPLKKRFPARSGKTDRARRKARRLSMPRLERELLSLLYQKAFQYSDQPVYKLASGRTSPYYIDCKKVTLDPHGAYLIGRLIFNRIKRLSPQGIGGLTLGADPIAQAVSMVSHLFRHPIPAFIVRKEPKGYGSASGGRSPSAGWIEGSLVTNSTVVVVDDVVTTGGSILKAIERLMAHNCKILKVIAIVDRSEGGKEAIMDLGYPYESLFTIHDLLNLVPSQK